MKPIDPKKQAARALQATAGILVAAAGIAAFDWRAGVATLGALMLGTSGFWRASS